VPACIVEIPENITVAAVRYHASVEQRRVHCVAIIVRIWATIDQAEVMSDGHDRSSNCPKKNLRVSPLIKFTMADVASALQKLATYRNQNSRASQETFDKGVIVLKSNVANKMGEEGACTMYLGMTINPHNCRRLGLPGATSFSSNRCRENRCR
jgi:hypothetical protein